MNGAQQKAVQDSMKPLMLLIAALIPASGTYQPHAYNFEPLPSQQRAAEYAASGQELRDRVQDVEDRMDAEATYQRQSQLNQQFSGLMRTNVKPGDNPDF